jgi:hypothetical protein
MSNKANKEIKQTISDYTHEKDFQDLDLYDSLTPNVKTKGKMILSYYPCCPENITDTPLETYYNNLKPGNIYCINDVYKYIVLEVALYNKKIIVKCESGEREKAIKPWIVNIVTFKKGKYISSLYNTYFHKDGADKYFTILQGKKWTGGDVSDDYCS